MRTFLILLILIIVLSIIACARLDDLKRRHEIIPPCECECNETWDFDSELFFDLPDSEEALED